MAKEKFKVGCCVDGSCNPSTCMSLPEGATCATCVHERRCCSMFGAKPTNTVCDFYPRRYLAKEAA